jgi:carboxylesterase
METPPILPGAEPLSSGNSRLGVLVLHGFTGSPQSVRPIAEALIKHGFSVEMPLLPGHGTNTRDMANTGYSDWINAAKNAYETLSSRAAAVGVVGLSMGGTLALNLAEDIPVIKGLALVNPLVEAFSPDIIDALSQMKASGIETVNGVGSDIAKPDVKELAYEEIPVDCVLSLNKGVERVFSRLHDVKCPIYVFTSKNDHVVNPATSDYLMEKTSGEKKRLFLESSFHVATLDYDADIVVNETVSFFDQILNK